MPLVSRTIVVAAAVVLLAGCSQTDAEESTGQTLIGPYTCDNLSVFFVRDGTTDPLPGLLTLEEALDLGKIEVIETGNVGELMVENQGDEPIFIQAGDIVKGGRQDRTLRFDIVIKPKSGKVPVESFCVEQGRWSARGDESPSEFGSSKNVLASKGLKLAARVAESQHEVWSQVSATQQEFSSVLGAPVAADESPTSLQLTLENDKVKAEVAACVEQLSNVLNGSKDVVGLVFAINGEINSADIYGSSTLFHKMWPKLIEAAALEARANPGDGEATELTAADIERWLAEASAGSSTDREIDGDLILLVTDSDENVAFETALGNGDRLLHKNVIKK